MSREIELKFQVGADRLAGVRRAVATTRAERVAMAARYFDTEDGALGRAGVALRLRREGARWVQTLKAQGAGVLQRLEHEVEVPAAQGRAAVPDLACHAGTPAGERLAELLAAWQAQGRVPPLVERYAVTFRRTRRVLATAGARVEMALDEGEITHGHGTARRRVPLCELEFELQAGEPAALLALAGRWAARHGLWLDTRSKAHRGALLAAGLEQPPPVGWRGDPLPRQGQPAQALATMLRPALDQVLANASPVAEGRHGPDHVHQLRVGLRRVRSVLRAYGPPDAPRDAALAASFRALGAARDADVLRDTLWPRLAAAGAPALADLPAAVRAPAAPVAPLLRAPAWTALMLALIALTEPPADPAPPQDLRALLWPPVQRLQRQVRRQARDFADLDEAGRHQLRKRLKRLRYLLEAGAGALPRKAAGRWRQRLLPAIEALGALNDVATGLARLREPAREDPAAAFALGWLTREHEQQAVEAECALRRLARLPRS